MSDYVNHWLIDNDELLKVKNSLKDEDDWSNYRHIHIDIVRGNARKRGVPFNLKAEDLIYPELCPVLLTPITRTLSKRYNPSVDRRDNSRGYVKDNIGIISHRANYLKSDMTIEDVERLLAYMKGEI